MIHVLTYLGQSNVLTGVIGGETVPSTYVTVTVTLGGISTGGITSAGSLSGVVYVTESFGGIESSSVSSLVGVSPLGHTFAVVKT